MGCALGLIALGVGYLVLLQANKEKKNLKLLGQAIGVLIMIAAVLSAVCAARCKMSGDCPLSGKAPMCPFSVKAAPPAVLRESAQFLLPDRR